MEVIAYIMLILVAYMLVDTSTFDRVQEVHDRADAYAKQIEYYQMQGLIYCEKLRSACPSGVLPLQQLTGSQFIYGTDIQTGKDTGSDGNSYIITTWHPRGAILNLDPLHAYGTVAAILKNDTVSSSHAGQWQAATQSIQVSYFHDKETGANSPVSVPIKQGFAGITLFDQSPIIASQLN